MIARNEDFRCFSGGDAHSDWHSATKTFCETKNVGPYTMFLEAEPVAASSHPDLDFVEHEEGVVFATKPFGFFHEFGGNWIHAPFAHDWFHEDGGGFMAEGFSKFVEVVGFDVSETGHEWLKLPLVAALTGGGGGSEGSSVVGLVESDDFVITVRSFGETVLLGNLDRGFVGGGSTDSEEGSVHSRVLADFFRELSLGGGEKKVGDMEELLGLPCDGGNDCRVAVSEVTNCDSSEEVEVFVSSVIPEGATGALDEKSGLAIVSVD